MKKKTNGSNSRCLYGLLLASPRQRLVQCCLNDGHDEPHRAKYSRTFFFEWSYVRRKAKR